MKTKTLSRTMLKTIREVENEMWPKDDIYKDLLHDIIDELPKKHPAIEPLRRAIDYIDCDAREDAALVLSELIESQRPKPKAKKLKKS